MIANQNLYIKLGEIIDLLIDNTDECLEDHVPNKNYIDISDENKITDAILSIAKKLHGKKE
jgi:hypothetical protein